MTPHQEELFDLFSKLGYELPREDFELVYGRATTMAHDAGGGNNPKCSIDSFRKKLNEFLTAKEYDSLDEWMAGK